MSELRTEKLGREKHGTYLSKADEFYQLMKKAEADGLWDGAALNAVHCSISSCDALTTFYLGLRSKGGKHEDVVLLMKRINTSGIQEKIKRLLDVLSVKNLVEYEAGELRENDAKRVVKEAEEIYSWVKQLLGT